MDLIDKAPATPSDPSALQALQDALYRSDEPITPETRLRIISEAAATMAAQMRDPLDVIRQANHYQRIRNALLDQWPSASFETRMSLREMVLSILRYEKNFAQLTVQDQHDLIDALPEGVREVFMFSRLQNSRMASDIWAKVNGDAELRNAPTVDQVWDTIKHLDPKMEEALQHSLDRSKFVRRDLEKTPRRRTG